MQGEVLMGDVEKPKRWQACLFGTLIAYLAAACAPSADAQDGDRVTVASRSPAGEAQLKAGIEACLPSDVVISVAVSDEVTVEISDTRSELSTRFPRPATIVETSRELCRLVSLFSEISAPQPQRQRSERRSRRAQRVRNGPIDPWATAPRDSAARLSNPSRMRSPRRNTPSDILDPWAR